jgi:hypothetical protein
MTWTAHVAAPLCANAVLRGSGKDILSASSAAGRLNW